MVGAERTRLYLSHLKRKRVGVTGNQTSLIGQQHLVDFLLEKEINVVKVYSPEHGFRGHADAGEHVGNAVDMQTGIPVVSLYGEHKKPDSTQMAGIDVMIFDIQDVGVRFYTYISTLHYIMEACAENDIKLIVLDRPNPNAHYVDGPVLDTAFRSFVGMHPVPIVYGMTIGEYAKMINGEKWLKDSLHCKLIVVPCANYTHDTPYSLPVAPSPNLRSDLAIQLYPSLCMLEATTVSVGRGTEGPFERYGHVHFPDSGYTFMPVSGYGAKDPKYKDQLCKGYNLKDENRPRPHQLDLDFLIKSNDLLDLAGLTFVDRPKFFNKLAGNKVLLEQILTCVPEEEIRKSWEEDLEAFKAVRAKYLLYE